MHRGFNLSLEWYEEKYYVIGKQLYDKISTQTNKILKEYVSIDKSLNGTLMQKHWFPNIKAEVFISHSHIDEKKAIALAGILHNQFSIVSFVDSCLWGHSNDLLKILDKEYCEKGPELYDYSKRNNSTSHVHMMLSTALAMMMDSTECLFFLNTPKSIIAKDVINETKSPWLYSEITISQLIRKKKLKAQRKLLEKGFSKIGSLNEQLDVAYEVDLNHLQSLNKKNLADWISKWKHSDQSNPLDLLYTLNPVE